MEPLKSATHTSKREFPTEELKETLHKMKEKFNIDSKIKGKEQAQKECEEEMKKNGIDEAVGSLIRDTYFAFLVIKLRDALFPTGEVSEEIEKNFEKPAAIYIVDTEDWEDLRISMTKDEIKYTSAKKVRGEIEIRTENIIQQLDVLSYLLQKGIEHKTFLCKVMGELPEYLQEMRRRKNKVQRDCQKYPSQENKRLSNQLARDIKRELASLRFNEYEQVKCSILNFRANICNKTNKV